MNKVPYVIALIIASFIYMMYLWKRKSGHLIFTIIGKRESTMALRDEEVVLELMGMWFNEGRYNEIINICDRLLQRDPDNNVVKLFRAKAIEKARIGKTEESVKMLFGQGEKKENEEAAAEAGQAAAEAGLTAETEPKNEDNGGNVTITKS